MAVDQDGYTDHSYYLLAGGAGIASDWVIEFSDPIFGNRWSADTVTLDVVGRTCGSITSQHDRAFIWAGVADAATSPAACGAAAHARRTPTSRRSIVPLRPTSCRSRTAPSAARDRGRAVRRRALRRARPLHRTFLGGDLPVSLTACVCGAGRARSATRIRATA